MHNRLKGLAISGHHPGIRGVCMMGASVKLKVEEAIFRQKIGTNQKTLKAFQGMKARNDDTCLVF
jgi:hypothetical protein